MKKSVFGIFAVLIAALFCGCKNKPASIATVTGVQKTLNGFSYNDAKTMMDNFKGSFIDPNKVSASQFTTPTSLYAFYDYAQIKEMNDLLSAEPQADGIRIYLGTENDIKHYTPGVTKVKYHMFIVTTSGPVGGHIHINYYDHNAPYLNLSARFGDAKQNDENNGASQGAKLFGTKPALDNCKNLNDHYIDNAKAFKWVQKRCKTCSVKNGSKAYDLGYNTRGEWFNICFIKGLFNAILDTKNKLSGLRIYLGNGYVDTKKTGEGNRDVFILFPTQQKDSKATNPHEDFYQCIQDLGDYFKNCQALPKTIPTTNDYKKAKTVSPGPSQSSLLEVDGYDEGELCPDNCN
jgi:hypothetical protein